MSTTTLAGLLLLLFQIEMFLHFFCVFMHSKIRMVFEILFLIQNSLTSNEILYFLSCVFCALLRFNAIENSNFTKHTNNANNTYNKYVIFMCGRNANAWWHGCEWPDHRFVAGRENGSFACSAHKSYASTCAETGCNTRMRTHLCTETARTQWT